MVGAAFGVVLLGIALLFLSAWAGIVVAAAGFVLAILFLLGRRADDRRAVTP